MLLVTPAVHPAERWPGQNPHDSFSTSISAGISQEP